MIKVFFCNNTACGQELHRLHLPLYISCQTNTIQGLLPLPAVLFHSYEVMTAVIAGVENKVCGKSLDSFPLYTGQK